MKTGKHYKRIWTVLLFSLFTLIGCDARADDHKVYILPVISGVDTVVSTSKGLKSKGRYVHYTLLYESIRGVPSPHLYKSHSPRFIESVIRESSDVMDSFLREKGITRTDCRGHKYNLIIILVSKDILSDGNRFQEFYKRKYGDNRKGPPLYGFYDSTLEVSNNSSIVLTDVGHVLNEQIFAHELAHFWWDKLCLPNKMAGSSEAFAQAFEAYYEIYKRRNH
jgi:hypothetical protein